MLAKFIFINVLLSTIGCLGIVGNCCLIWLFTKANIKLNFHHLMIVLAIYDTVLVALCILVFVLPEVVESYKSEGFHYHIAPFAIAVIQTSLTGSIYCTVGISIERYLTVCHPFYLSRKKWSAKRYIIPIVLFSLIYNTTRFFEHRMEYNDLDDMKSNMTIPIQNDGDYPQNYGYEIKSTSLRRNKYYYSIYTIGCNFVFNGLIPFTIIISLNSLLYKRLKQIWRENPRDKSFSCVHPGGRKISTRRRLRLNELELAKVSLIVIIIFVICNSIRWIPNIYELLQRLKLDEDDRIEWPEWVSSMIQVNHFLTVFNSSVNFYVYYFTHYGMSLKLFKMKSRPSQKQSQPLEKDVIISGRVIEASIETESMYLREMNCS